MTFGLVSRLRSAWHLLLDVQRHNASMRLALGRIEARQTAGAEPGNFEAAEFQVSSQWGEDGIIEHLLRHVPVPRTVFVEFGVEDYRESNTRFLLQHRNWSGLVLDGSAANVAAIRRDSIYWKYDLTADAAFITRENINGLISGRGITGDIGLLSVDVDGNDYWIWESIDCVTPRIVIVEYNALFGDSAAVSIPYDPGFERTKAHHSNLYWGCSLAALERLGKKKGYSLVGCNSNGNNAFFVRSDVRAAIPELTPKQAYRAARYRESRNAAGELTYMPRSDAIREIGSLPLVDVGSGASLKVVDI